MPNATEDSEAAPAPQEQLVPASEIEFAVIDEQPPHPGIVRALVTRTFNVRASGCTCGTSSPCACCLSYHRAAAAREARQGLLA